MSKSFYETTNCLETQSNIRLESLEIISRVDLNSFKSLLPQLAIYPKEYSSEDNFSILVSFASISITQ